ncbi:MAG: ATP-dependent helicase [Actinomycetota bacterium]|nr:ATP-dependent helicase [Actinomycetota bacterium]
MSPSFPPEIVAAMGAEPTDEQWHAISMPLEPYVVVAGAGSGKTSVMAARVVYLALVGLGRIDADHEGVLPGNVLCLTFTNKATENLIVRVRSALRSLELPEGEEPEILNYHGFAAQVLERHGLLAGIEPGQRILTSTQRNELCARVLEEMTFDHVRAEWQPSLIQNILDLSDQAANHRVDPLAVVAFNETRRDQLRTLKSTKSLQAAEERIELAIAAERYRAIKEDLGVIDFGDQITLALKTAEGFSDVATDYRSRFRTLILDEYQDTNVAQADLIDAVFGGGFPVTAVGDPDQNIYAWRGASLFNLLQFPTRFARADGAPAEKLPLYTNFRSGARILAAADKVIEPLPANQRPDPGKELRPFPPNGEGEVELARLPDEEAEAAWIGDRIVTLHDGGEPWSSVAVLCRKSRLFVPLQHALAERRVPVEIVGLAGLLKLPAVVEVLAYARAVDDPYASVDLARILLGPRYRVGFKDLARVAAWAKGRNYELRDEEEDETTPFLFAEALEHLDDETVREGLSDEGYARLQEFRRELAELRTEARRPVGEFLAEIVRSTGLLAELEASPDVAASAATRRNLAAFLDEVHAFAPVDGDLTLREFLDYVRAEEELERQEWAPVQPSDEDSVKVMTIHQAKGLEFDTVFVPGFAKEILPDARVQQNPAEKGKSLDFDLRGDADILPKFNNNLKQFWFALREQAMIEERRTAYVALTRAKQRLFITGAHWYGEGETAKKPSEFFDELAAWAKETGSAAVDLGAEVSEENPLIGYRERFVQPWPGSALRTETDPLFRNGWRRAATVAEQAGGADALLEAEGTLLEGLAPEEVARFHELASGRRTAAAAALDRDSETPAPPRLPATIAVSGAIEYARCPKRFYWTTVRPLPSFSGPAARIGTQVHRWIELRSSGQTSLLELDEAPDLTAEELSGQPGKVDRLQQSFLSSRFAGTVPLFAERPFLLHVDGFVISGRIDAIYGDPDGDWEIVDYKTGRRPQEDDPLASLQLDVYALACVEVWRKSPEQVKLTYLYLASGEEVSHQAGDPQETRARLLRSFEGMAAGEFEPTPGPQCRWCDFLSFCDAGQAYMAERAEGVG